MEDGGRLLRTALEAARRFLDAEVEFEPLGHGDAVTFRVTAPGGRYALRLHLPRAGRAPAAFRTVAALEAECAWLRALSRETALVVPDPVALPSGEHVLRLAAPDGAEPLACTLLRWVEGAPPDGPRTADEARALGELLAALHAHARSWRPPAGFSRPRHEPAAWRAALERTRELEPLGVADGAQLRLLERVVETAEGELAHLAHDPRRVGLIHADLHGGNVLFLDGTPRPIDFGRAGIGPWLYDVAECVGQLGAARRSELLEAYAAHHPLEDGDLRRLEGYFAAALVEVFGRCAGDPDEREYLARALPAWRPHLERYVASRPFLLEL